ncbi:MAG: PD-(D/E)XK nuclease family protein, partial [Candidatus Omnitrophica bacterium]|nr:PD-(D/E)XK nuclease family protein [Candidatus Omnitrophota bacterium]
MPWAKEILNFIEQMDLEDVNPEALKNIQFNAQIGYDVPKNINALLMSIVSIRTEYHKLLLRKKSFSRGLMYLEAKKNAERLDFNEFENIVFCGFFYLHKAEMDFMKKLYDRGIASFLFQGSSEEWTVLDNVAKALAISIKPEWPPAKRKDRNVSIYSGFDIHSEACIARELVKKIKNPEETVIVLPDASNVIPLLCEISNFVKDFNISMGYPLNRSSVYSLFECIFRAQETLRKGGRAPDAYYTKDYLKVLGHPLIKNLKLSEDQSLTRVLIHKIEEVLLGSEKTALGGSLFVRLSEIETSSQLYDLSIDTMKSMNMDTNWDELKEIVSRLHRILFHQWEKIGNFNEFSSSLDRLLDELVNKSSLSSYPLNLKMVERLFSIKDELAGVSFGDEKFAKEDIFKIFKNGLDGEHISFSGSPLKGLQILGLFETRSLNFENVLIMDANESVLPSLKIYEPLIPREIMISLGINRIEKEEEIQRYQFTRLVRSAKTAHLLYQKRNEKEKSRFLEEIIWEKEKESGLGSVQVPQASFNVKVLPKRLEIEKTPDTVKFLKEMSYSASSVNTYLWCPLRFYYQYVLGLKEKEELLDEPEGKDVGTFIHELFEAAFSKFINKRPCIDKTFKDVFFAMLD